MQTETYRKPAANSYMETIKAQLNETIIAIKTLQEDTGQVSDPKAKALFLTTSDVLKDLVAAYDLYENKAQ